jgi:ADP-ribose pyrophosphatase YjhB (NUDIX family)
VGVLIRKCEEYLLILRAVEPDRGYWSVPGGLVEVGERLEEAAIREVEEETGLMVELRGTLGVVDNIVKDEVGKVKYHFILVDFLAEPIFGEMRHRDDALDARWVNPRDFRGYKLSPSLVDLLKKSKFYPEF